MKALGKSLVALGLAVGLLGPGATHAQRETYEKVLAEELKAAKDHPWTGRYGGSTLLLQSVAAYDELVLPSGPAEWKDGVKRFADTVRTEGRVTRTVYVTPPGRSSLEVFRNYRNHLEEQGFVKVFECAGNDGCGDKFKELKYHWSDRSTHVTNGEVKGLRTQLVTSVFDGGKDIRYALLRKGEAPQAAYVGVFVARSEGGSFGNASTALNGYVVSLLEVVEPEAMEAKIEIIKSEAIASGLQSAGAVALYGLFFDTDKAVLKPESEPQLAEMVRYLKDNDVKVYVVGHTDSQGKLDYNLDLSERRAKAVATALVERGIPASRMIARGVGPLAPAAPNGDEAGRAKNRRVELVLQ